MDLAAVLVRAIGFHEAGRLGEAGALYQQILSTDPRNADALHLMGVVLHQAGQQDQAVAFIEKALSYRPKDPAFLNNLGAVHQARQAWEPAIEAYRGACERAPGFGDAAANFAELASRYHGRLSEADGKLLKCALCHAPDHARLTRLTAATFPGHEERLDWLSRRALPLDPLSGEAWVALGISASELDKWALAARAYRLSALAAPGGGEAERLVAYTKRISFDYEAARIWIERARVAAPQSAAVWSTMAEVYAGQGLSGEAVSCSQQAVSLDPINARLHYRLGEHLLDNGQVEEGWREYDWFFKLPNAVKHRNAPPRWEGQSLQGKTLLITADQGIGDEIVAASLYRLAEDAGARLVIDADPRLVECLQRSFPRALVAAYDREKVEGVPVQDYRWIPADWRPDYRIEGLALPRFFRRSIEEAEAQAAPWLTPDPDRVAAFRTQKRPDILNVGVVWRSRRLSTERNVHYPGIEMMAQLFEVEGCHFVSLQYGDGWEEEARPYPIEVAPNLDTLNDIDGVLAKIAALDLVICPASTVGWLGAAIDVPVWVLGNRPYYLSYGTDYQPGYPSVRRFEKLRGESWEPVIQSSLSALKQMAS